jgi:myosin-15
MLIFLACRLDNRLYIEVVFNQIAPDYLEGLLLVMPGEQIDQEAVYQVLYLLQQFINAQLISR